MTFSILFSRDLDVQFISEDMWLMGVPVAGGEAFDNGTMYGMGLYGTSSVDPFDAVNVDIHFSSHPDSSSVAYVFSASNLGVPLGLGVFPGSVWDMNDPENPRRLNICFFETTDGDLEWNPTTVSGMDLEYLLIMATEYDASGEYYAEIDITTSDVQYFSWLRRRAGQTWFSSEPAILEYRNYWEFSHFDIVATDNTITLEWEHENPQIEYDHITHYEVKIRVEGNQNWTTQTVPVEDNQYEFTELINGIPIEAQVFGLNNDSQTIEMESEIIISTPMPVWNNTTLLAQWDGAADPLVGASKYNDIWGYTDPSGTEFALIGQWNGTSIVDISTDLANPQLIEFIPGSYSSHRDIKSFGEYIYIGTEANRSDPYSEDFDIIQQGIQVVDMTDPTNPELVNEWDGIVQSHNIMSEDDPYLYVIGANDDEDAWGAADLIILDLSDPVNPVKVGEWNGGYLHDVCLDGDILYGMGIYTDSIYAIDISDKSNPELIISWGGIPSSHACWVSDDGHTLFSASETSYGHILSWDVSNLFNINLLDEWYPELGEEWSVHNIFYKNGFIFASHYAFGLQIVDVRNPYEMQTAGFFDTYPYSGAGLFDGAWGTFPYFESNRIIVSDRKLGLFVIEFTEEDWTTPFQMGDINTDGVVDILDIVMIVAYIIDDTTFTEPQQFVADMNMDGIINILDIMTMVYFILHG
jgi:choice-of-anchor B domain-containing protein